MVDPKFNALPTAPESDLEDEEGSAPGAGRGTKPRRGLSINDTIAAGADMSVGSRGVDTSGTAVGAGAGAGTTFVTPQDTGSPAPNIVSGARGSGTTPRGDTATDQTATTRLDAGNGRASRRRIHTR